MASDTWNEKKQTRRVPHFNEFPPRCISQFIEAQEEMKFKLKATVLLGCNKVIVLRDCKNDQMLKVTTHSRGAPNLYTKTHYMLHWLLNSSFTGILWKTVSGTLKIWASTETSKVEVIELFSKTRKKTMSN